MLCGENIICFAKDWSEDPTSNNHVMRLLAKDNRVLWMNSLALRTPKLSSGRDLNKIVKKLKSFAQGVKQVDRNLWVYTPIVLPLPYSAVAAQINRQILRATVTLLRHQLEMKRFQLWTFLPTSGEYVGQLGEDFSVYYCTDEFSKFSYLDATKIPLMERDLIQKVDVVFATAHSLLERKKVHNPHAFLASHGVDYAHFAKALDSSTPIPAEIASIKRPILGFFGLIHDWIDQDLFCYIAERRPDWSIVLIGQANVDTSRVKRFSNIHLLGRKPYADLPGYCRAFSIGLIPFAVNELTAHVNPIKLREYLSAGLPVVSTPLPEVTYYQDICSVTDTHEAFLAACDKALAEDSAEAKQKRCQAMAKETWEQKVSDLGDHIAQVRARR